jgi:hypothetical protein
MVSRIFDVQINDGSDNRWSTRVFGFNVFFTPNIRSVIDSASQFPLVGFEQEDSLNKCGEFTDWEYIKYAV